VAMTPEKLVQRLEAANHKLQQVRQHLMYCKPPDVHVIPLLNQITETLKSLQCERELIVGSEAIQRSLQSLRVGTARASELLESAENLICNSTLERPLIVGAYTPDGSFPSLNFGGKIIVHA
jgi:hypothetical protein